VKDNFIPNTVKTKVATTALVALAAAALAQGSLTPPGPPGQTYRTLGQIEPRAPITNSGAANISAPGSYYLTGNITVSSGHAITIASDNVTLDLNGFTISSTENPASSGAGVVLAGGRTNITIANGAISSGVTNNGGTYSGPGFGYGIGWTGNPPRNARVSRVSVAGCLVSGIYLNQSSSCVVESCAVTTAGGYGIYADSISDCTALNCGMAAIAGFTANNCVGTSASTAAGVNATSVANCYGYSPLGSGISATAAINSYGISAGGVGLFAWVANNCFGESAAGNGVQAINAHNCYGISSTATGLWAAETATGCSGHNGSGYDDGVDATVAESCYGVSANQNGINAETVNNCHGSSVHGNGLYVFSATNCRGESGTGVGLSAYAANNCYGETSSDDAMNGAGILADVMHNCRARSDGAAPGLWATAAENCYGTSSSGIGLRADGTANSCTGSSSSGTALQTCIAIGCTTFGGPVNASCSKWLGTP
jgi:hypothetical protein